MQEIKKIVIIGPESTGKSTLCQQLADYYKTLWCPEYAREYLLKHGTNYTYEDLLEIAKGQMRLEDEYVEKVSAISYEVSGMKRAGSHSFYNAPESGTREQETPNYTPLFIDTNMYVMKVWCEFVFEKCHQLILDKIVEKNYDLYLLCNTDLPWTRDELREYPHPETREKLYHIYKDILINQDVPWTEISGTNEQRLQQAITACDKLIFSSPF